MMMIIINFVPVLQHLVRSRSNFQLPAGCATSLYKILFNADSFLNMSLFQALVSKCAAVKQSAQLDEEEEASSVVLKEDNGITFIPLSSVSSPPFASFSCPVARRLPPPPSPFYPNHPPYNTLSPPHQLPAISHCLIQYLSKIFPTNRAKCCHILCYYFIFISCILLNELTTSNHVGRIFHHTDFASVAVGSNLTDFAAFKDRHAHL